VRALATLFYTPQPHIVPRHVRQGTREHGKERGQGGIGEREAKEEEAGVREWRRRRRKVYSKLTWRRKREGTEEEEEDYSELTQ
jgi:hypothetical protein